MIVSITGAPMCVPSITVPAGGNSTLSISSHHTATNGASRNEFPTKPPTVYHVLW